jgi:hypothetical protein
MGRGDPLNLTAADPGGVGIGSGDPLRTATEVPTARLLENCLTELLTGSTIKTAATRNTRQMDMFFFMVDNLLVATMKKSRTC